MKLYARRSAFLHADTPDQLTAEMERLLKLLRSEGGEIEHLGEVIQVEDGDEKGTYVQTLDYVRPIKVLS